MAGLDMSKLQAVQKNLDSKGGDGLFVKQSDLGEETDFRIAVPKANLSGLYFLAVKVWWINKKVKLVSFASFGKPDVVQEEIDDADPNDKGVQALINDDDKLSLKEEFWVPGYFLKVEFNADWSVKKLEVVDDKCKVLQAGPQLIKAVNKVVTSRNFQNGTEDGITDRVLGSNIILTKTGKKMQTEYGAEGWKFPYEMPEKYYDDAKIPDLKKLALRDAFDEEYQRGVIRNYLYGEDLPDRPKTVAIASEPAATTSRTVATAPTGSRTAKSEKKALPPAVDTAVSAGRGRKAAQVADDDLQSEPVSRRGAAPAPAGRTAAASARPERSILDDVESELDN